MKKPFTVFRVENKDGRGPYCVHNGLVDEILSRHGRWYHRPPALDKGINRDIRKYEVSAFADMASLSKWFSVGCLAELALHGFEVKEVEVEQITAVGLCQVLCIKKERIVCLT